MRSSKSYLALDNLIITELVVLESDWQVHVTRYKQLLLIGRRPPFHYSYLLNQDIYVSNQQQRHFIESVKIWLKYQDSISAEVRFEKGFLKLNMASVQDKNFQVCEFLIRQSRRFSCHICTLNSVALLLITEVAVPETVAMI